jgi:hypothetical protein
VSHTKKVVVLVPVGKRWSPNNRQIRQLPVALQQRECGLIEIGRPHARNFDAGHAPSRGGVQRVLTELRKQVTSPSPR